MRVLFVTRSDLQRELFGAIASADQFIDRRAIGLWLDLNREAPSLTAEVRTLASIAARVRDIRTSERALECRINEARPDAIVLANDRPYAEQVILRLARRVGVPTVFIQDGWIPRWRDLDWPLRLRHAVAHLAGAGGFHFFGASRPGRGHSDYCGVMGERWLSVVRSRSGQPGSVRVVGQPLFDRPAADRAHDDSRQETPPPRRVLFLASNFANGFRDAEAQCAQVADIVLLRSLLDEASDQTYDLVVRPHPLDEEDVRGDYRALSRVRVEVDQSLRQAVAASDLVVSNLSSASLAATAARRPVFALAVNLRSRRYAGLLRMLPHRLATTTDEARSLLARLRDQTEVRAWVEGDTAATAPYLSIDPEIAAADRVVDLISRAASGSLSNAACLVAHRG